MPPKKQTRSEQLSLRVEPSLVERIDDLRAGMKRKLRGLEVSRSDLLLTMIQQALPVMEMEYLSDREPRQGRSSPGDIRAMVEQTVRIMLDLADSYGVEPEIAGYARKKKK